MLADEAFREDVIRRLPIGHLGEVDDVTGAVVFLASPAARLITGTVLLVNSPHAEAAVSAWRRAGSRPELGWHPCLTLDAPILPPSRVPSLVAPDGRFLKDAPNGC